MTHLELGGEVLHDGADELGFVGSEGDGGVAARSGGLSGVFHGVSVVSDGNGFWFFGFWFLCSSMVFGVVEQCCWCQKRKIL